MINGKAEKAISLNTVLKFDSLLNLGSNLLMIQVETKIFPKLIAMYDTQTKTAFKTE
jgi:hypothetical protein